MVTKKQTKKKRMPKNKARDSRPDVQHEPIIRLGARISHYRSSKFDIGSLKKLKTVSKNPPEVVRFMLPPKPARQTERLKFAVIPEPLPRVKVSLSQIVFFAAIGFVLTVTIQGVSYLSIARLVSGEILGAATSAYDNLHSASSNLKDQNFEQASALFAAAQNNLSEARSRMDQYKTLSLILPQAKSADSVLSGAYLLSQSGEKLTEALKLFDDLKVTSDGIQTENFNLKLVQNKTLLSESLGLLKQSEQYFNQSNGLSKEYLPTLAAARDQISLLSETLQGLISLEDLYLSFLGVDGKTYLLLFQNSDEIRATGGFIGTYGVLKMDNGNIRKLKIESIYDLEGQIFSSSAAPGPFQPQISKWGMRDANWFVDFPSSAQKLLKFFEKGRETADGIIAVTPKLFSDLLRLTGPIQMEQYGVVLTPDNFQDVVQEKTSIDYDRTLNQPKKFLADFAPILLNRLTNLKKEQWFSFFQILNQNLAGKQVLLYSTDQNTQGRIDGLGFAGRIKSSESDYLAVFNTNMGGTKTDLKVGQEITLATKILEDGSIVNTLRIKRKNNSVFDNRDYLRILVPLGSELISTSGGDSDPHLSSSKEGLKTDPDLALWDKGKLRSGNVFVRTEADKTEFAAWLKTPANSDRQITFTYQLPFKINRGIFDLNSAYSLLLQKQPGAVTLLFNQTVDFGGMEKVWSTGNLAFKGNLGTFYSSVETDDYWGIILK